MGQLSRIAPLAAGIWHRAPQWLQGAITWTVNGKVIVGVSGALLNEENQVLLLRHRFHNNRIWGLPGGLAVSRRNHLRLLAPGGEGGAGA